MSTLCFVSALPALQLICCALSFTDTNSCTAEIAPLSQLPTPIPLIGVKIQRGATARVMHVTVSISPDTRLVVQAKLSLARAPPSSRQKSGNASVLLRKVKCIAQDGRETTADLLRISAKLNEVAATLRLKPASAGAGMPGAPGEAAALATHACPLDLEELEDVASRSSGASAEAGSEEAGVGASAAAAATAARTLRVSAFEEDCPEGMPWADVAAGEAAVAMPGAAAGLEGVKDGRGCPAAMGDTRGSRRDGTWGASSLMAQSVTSPLAERSSAVWRIG